VNAKWQLVANGLVELPAGFELGAALFGRQGFPRPILLRLPAGLDGRLPALATDRIDSQRYPDLWNLDLRLAKSIRLGSANLMVETSVFNVFNWNTEQDRFIEANSSAFNRLDELLAPRVARIGARVTF